MNWLNSIASTLILASVYVSGAISWDYSDLEAMNVVCPQRDSCRYRANQTYTERNCECDSKCTTYNDCCINAIVSGRNRNTQPGRFVCTTYDGNETYNDVGVYAMSRCASGWQGPAEVRQKCESSGDLSDPILASPVTDARNKVTYRNRFCAECNGVQGARLTSWNLKVYCDSLTQTQQVTDQYVWENLQYREDINRWGVYQWNRERGHRDFYSCDVVFNLPSYLEGDVRKCRANVTSTCPRTWRRAVTRRACEAYMALVSGDGRMYRNPHCAVCNNVTVDRMNCNPGVQSKKKTPMSFALLLDVNQSDGDVVGMTRQSFPSCPSGQKYDPFFKRCRVLVCSLPGTRMSNGRCVRS